jgi:predicted RNA methylase
MSSDEISNVIKTQIMPNAPQANVAPVAGSTKVADVLQRSIFGPIDAIMPGSNLANEPTPSIGSLAKGIKSLSNVPTQWQLSSQLELIETNKRKYGQNFENAPEKEKSDILNTVKKASENLSYLAQSGEDVKAIEQKYGKDPLSKKIDALEQKPDFKNATEWQQAGMIGKEYLKNIDELPSYIANVGLSSLPQSIAMAVAARFGMAAGPTGGLIVGGGSSAMMEYGQQYVELRERGFNHEEANNKAMVKSSIIGMFDAASLRSAGKIAEKIFDNTATKVWKETVKDVAKEIPKQASLGAAGEGLGSYASNQPVNPRAVLEEAIGEVFGAPAEAAATYKSKKAEAEQVPPSPPPAPPAVVPAPNAPSAPPSGLVDESDLETFVPPNAPPSATPAAVVAPVATSDLETKINDWAAKAEATGEPNTKELNKIAKEYGITPAKEPQQTLGLLLDKMSEQTTESVAPPAETIPPIDMGENTEYRIVKNDNGWTAVLFDNDANQMVSATTFPTDKFGDQEGKQKAIEFAQSEAEKAAPYNQEAPEEAPSEEKPSIFDQVKNGEFAGEVTAEDAQQAIDKLVEEDQGDKVTWAAPPPLTPEEIAQNNRDRQAAQRAEAQGETVPTVAPEATGEALSPEAQADKDLMDALGELSWMATKNTRMNMMPEDEQRLMPTLIKLMDAAFRKGYHTFKKAAKFVRDLIKQAFGKDVSDKINLNHLQGAYIAMSGNYPSKATPIAEVAGVKSIDELEEKGLQATELTTSKDGYIADKNGKPIVFYHTTRALDENGNQIKELIPGGPGGDGSGKAIWFGPDPNVMQAAHNAPIGKEGSYTIPAYIKMESPLYIDEFNYEEQRAKWGPDLPFSLSDERVKKLKDAGFDGIISEITAGQIDEVVVFDKNQVTFKADYKTEKPAGKLDLATPDGKYNIALVLADHFLEGNAFSTIVEARKFISELTGEKIEAATMQAKQADEAVEVGIVLAAQEISQNSKSPTEAYDRLVDLYNRQPNLAVRSSTSVREQAYSTPAPLAYVASQLAGINQNTTVYEPTAGNGMLLIAANPNIVIVNELNSSRAEMLKRVFPKAEVTVGNALKQEATLVDVVIENPPFGSTGENFDIDGFKTREIDHAIVMKSLQNMKPGGKAVLIIGGVRAEGEDARREGYRSAAKRNFFVNLYDKYNVVDHFSVSGDMYTKQGASYPVDVIVINGDGKAERALPAAELPQQINSYEELKEKLNASMVSRANVSPSGTNIGERTPGGANQENVAGSPSGQASRPSGGEQQSTGAGKPNVPTNGAGISGRPESTGAGTGEKQPKPANKPDNAPEGSTVPSAGKPKQPPSGKGAEGNKPGGVGGTSVVSGERIQSRLNDRRGKEEVTEGQVPYQPKSKANSVGTLVPGGMAQSIRESLDKVEAQVGDIDEYVSKELGFTKDELFNNFSAEQIDSLALSIFNADAGQGFIIGDQTGVGKGRVVAAMIKYALKNDRIPIFVTQFPNLFSDMIRDLDDIGMTKELALDTTDPKIFMTNVDQKVPYKLVRTVNGEKVEKELTLEPFSTDRPKQNAKMKELAAQGNLGNYKVIFTTYKQLQNVKGKATERQRFVQALADQNYLILDESHNAGVAGKEGTEGQQEGGDLGEGVVSEIIAPNIGSFIRMLVNDAYGSFFSSATYAKRADIMDLYASTDMKLAVKKISDLAEAIKNGGIPMQQIVANMLAKVGQYIRRERTFAGVSYNTEETKVNKETAENMATSMRDILAFSRAVGIAGKKLAGSLDTSGAVLAKKKDRVNVETVNFGSTMHNLIDQMLLSLKAQSSVDHAISRLKAGEKVVLTVSNTMGSFLESYSDEMELKKGDPINLNFSNLYLKYLKKQRQVTIKYPAKNGNPSYKEVRDLTDEELGPELTVAYNAIVKFIQNAGFEDAPVSPIDYMHYKLRQAGFKTGEITGRNIGINYSGATEASIPTLQAIKNTTKTKYEAITKFNGGEFDVLILNQAGSTGLSLHASENFKDQRKRHMIIVQAEKNIDTHMQMLGRVHRTGQIIPPAYSQMMADIPAEMRPAAILLKKMASLNANTTASRKSAVTAEGAVDFMNDYGGQVANELLADNPDLHESLGGDNAFPVKENSSEATEEDVRKLTGYIPILPIKEQEEFYKDLTERYKELLDREISMGTNKLEAKALDINAETLSSTPITENKGDSLFAQPAFMELIEADRTVKPMSSEEVIEAAKKNLDGKSPGQLSLEQRDALTAKMRAYTAERIELEVEKKSDEVRLSTVRGQLNLQETHIDSILRTYTVGKFVTLTNELGVALTGAIIDVKNVGKTKNPAAGTDWKMTFALANGDARSITLPFSQIGKQYKLETVSSTNTFNYETQQFEDIPVIKQFDMGSQIRREKRWMVTGNILAGFAAVKNKGQITNFKDNEGYERQGILMPRAYDFAKEQKDAPVEIATADNAMRFLDEIGGTITSEDGILRITKSSYGNQYQFNVPSSKKEGGTYFLDRRLTDILGDFYKSGSTMYARGTAEEARKAIDVILNKRQETLVTKDNKERAKKLFAPEPLENIVPRKKTTKQIFDSRVRNEIIAEQRKLNAQERKLKRQIINGEVTLDAQREMTFIDERTKELEENLEAIKDKTPPDALSVHQRAERALRDGEISQDVFNVIHWMWNNSPALLTGLKLQIRKPTSKEEGATGSFNPLDRLVRLYKGTEGVTDPETARHELTHTLEQMMTPQVRKLIVQQWAKETKKAIKNNTDPASQDYFQAINDYMANPTKANYEKVRELVKDLSLYQYANPSDYWAVNAEKLMAMKMGTAWNRFVLAVKKLFEGMKSLFGFDNQYILYKTFDDLMKGKTPRMDYESLKHFFDMTGPSNELLFNIADDVKLLDKIGVEQPPVHTNNTVQDYLMGGYQTAKNIKTRILESPRNLIPGAVTGIDKLALGFRVKATDFTAGLAAEDAVRYDRELLDGEGRAVASIAADQQLKANHIATQVVTLGKLAFDSVNQMFKATEDKNSTGKIIQLAHEFGKEVGVKHAFRVINGYFEAKRSRSIVNEYLKRQGELETLKTEALDPDLPPDRQLALTVAIQNAQENFEGIDIARQKVNLKDTEIDDLIALEKKYPVLREMMDIWNDVSRNMVNMMEFGKIISKQTADMYRKIDDYVPWQRIQPEDISQDPSKPTFFYGAKGVRNVSREHKFKPGEVELALNNVLDNMVNHVVLTSRNVIKNYAANRIASEYGERNEKGKLKVYPKEDFARGIVKILVNGRKINIRIVDPLIAQAVIGMESMNIPLMGLMGFGAQTLRRTITYSGVFQLRQLFMDIPSTILVTGVRNPLSFYGSVFGSFVKSLNNNDPVVKILKAHGIGNIYSSSRTSMQYYDQTIGLLNGSKLQQTISLLEKIGDASDMAPRRATYLRVMKETKGDQRKALLASANVINWDKKGSSKVAQTLAHSISFMNAFAQQIDVLSQALLEPVAYGVEKTTGAKVKSVSGGLKGQARTEAIERLATAIACMQIGMLMYLFAIGDDEEYQRLDDQTKMRNFFVPRKLMKQIGYDHSLLIPLTTTAGYLVKAIPEMTYNRIITQGTKNEVDATRFWKALRHGGVDALLGPLASGPVPTVFKPFVEIGINHNFFTGGKVVPESMKHLEAYKQYNANVSQLGKWLSAATQMPFTGKEDKEGNTIEGSRKRILSPIEADHLARGLFGSVAGLTMWMSDLLSSNKPTKEERNNPLYGSFVAPEVPRGREDLFYDLKARSDVAMTTFKTEMKNMNPTQGKKWFEANKGLIQANGFTQSAGASLNAITGQIRRIEDLPLKEMSADEKRKEINFLKGKKEEILQDTIRFRLKAGL